MNRVAHHTLARYRLKVCHAIEGGSSYASAAKRFAMPRTVVMFWHRRWKAERKAFHALFNRKAGPRRPRARFELWPPIRELWGKGVRGLRLKRALEHMALGWKTPLARA